jgi:hypothetical protein
LGKRIREENLSGRAGYGDSVLTDLAADLEIDVTTLRRSVSFFEAYKMNAPRGTNLSWAHYRELSQLPDPKERAWYEKEADREGWTRDALVSAMGRDAFTAASGDGKKKAPKLRRPTAPTYLYKAWVDEVIDGDSVPRKTAQEMRAGPSKPICGNGLQSALSGIGQNPMS